VCKYLPLPDLTGLTARLWARARHERIGLGLLALALLFNAVALAPELEIGRLPPNDSVFHLAAAERLGESIVRHEPFLDPWVSDWALGYPVWRSYQPLPHLLAAAVIALARAGSAPADAFAALQYVLLVLLPACVYLGARLLALGPGGAGLAACLALAGSASGNYGRYGLSYGAFTWRGSGLYTQLVALDLLPIAIGAVARALDGGRRRTIAALLLVLTSLSHIIFGYVAFVSGAVVGLVGRRGERSRRVVRLATVVALALVLLAWFVAPLFLAREVVNHSRWEDQEKWDSYGAAAIVKELATGRLFDAGRAPVLSLLIGVGAVAAALAFADARARRLLALTGAWLLLFFGRATWGHLTALAGIPADLHMHRLQAAFELSALLLAAWGLEATIATAWRWRRAAGAAAALVVAAGLVVIAKDRAAYLRENAAWGRANLAAFERESGDVRAALDDVRAILAERPGRTTAGKAATWGRDFKVGSMNFFALLTRDHLDEVSFLYHSMSLPSDIMVLRNEDSPVHDIVFGVRAVVAPTSHKAPAHWKRRGLHGRIAVYEASPEGYFGIVDVIARYAGPPGTTYDPSSSWLASSLPSWGMVVAFRGGDPALPPLHRWEAMPAPVAALKTFRGDVVSESKVGEVYSARLDLARPCHALLKISWDPGLVATVDDAPAPVLWVTPGFAAVPVAGGRHRVVVTYAPGPLRPVLLLAGIALFVAGARALRWARLEHAEERLAAWIAARTRPLATARNATALTLALAAVVALHPLLRGKLVQGHDATEYPQRVVEFARAIGDGHIPPVWAPDLGSGYGQPLFEFAPPLLYATALPFHWLGAGLADSLQLALALLHALGAVAVYRLGRRWRAARLPALAGAIAWLLAPYVSLDLFVRAAFAEAAAVAMAPVALLGVLRAADRPSASRVALGAIGVALLVLGHNGAALLILPALALVVLASTLAARPRLPALLGGGLAIAGGMALSAFFWLPALLEKGLVKTDLLREGFLNWSEHIIAPWQLLWSRWGYGVSVPGTGDGMSFALGPVHLLLAAAGVALLLRGGRARARAEGIALAAVALAGAWLATTLAAPVWARVGTLQYLAYPWRALMLPALALPLLAVPVLQRLPRWALFAAVAALAATNLAHTEPKGYFTFDEEYYAPQNIAEKGIGTTTRDEYEPRAVTQRPSYTAVRLSGAPAPIEIRTQELRSARQRFEVHAAAATTAELATLAYPGWRITVDGTRVEVTTVDVRGTMSFALPAGDHTVVAELRLTPLRRAPLFLSVLAALSLAAAVIGSRRRRAPAQIPA
jgi:uncharacterized membrane protein